MARFAPPVHLPACDHSVLRAIVTKGTHKSRKITRARALLLMGSGKKRRAVQAEAGISANPYYCLKRRYLAAGLAEALEERPRSGQPPKGTAALEAHITRLACREAPAGAARWALSLLAERVVEWRYVETISDETVRNVLKKANSSPGASKCGASARGVASTWPTWKTCSTCTRSRPRRAWCACASMSGPASCSTRC